METENLLDFAGYKLLAITKQNLTVAADAVENGRVDGIVVSKIRGYAEKNLNCLLEFKKLNILAITDLVGVDISAIAKLFDLRFLSIGDTNGAVELNGLHNLTHLRLEISKGRVLPSEGLPYLTHLAIWKFGEVNLSILRAYQEIRSLELIQARKLASLTGLENCQKLAECVIAYCPALRNIDALSSLRQLQSIDFENTKKIESYLALGEVISVNRLLLDKTAPINSLEFLCNLRKLTHLVIRNTQILDLDLSPLKSLSELSHIYLDQKKEYEPCFTELKRLINSRKAP